MNTELKLGTLNTMNNWTLKERRLLHFLACRLRCARQYRSNVIKQQDFMLIGEAGGT